MNAFNIPFKFIKYLLNKLPPFLNYIWTFMAIHIQPLLGLLALIPKLVSEPLLGCQLCDCSIDPKGREND